MNIDQAVADAIQRHYDILEDDRNVMDVKTSDLDNYVERRVRILHFHICDALSLDVGREIIKDGSAERMTSYLISMGIGVPPEMLYVMCKGILENLNVERQKIIDIKYVIPVINEDGTVISTMPQPGRKDASVWYIKMNIDCDNLFA